MQNSRVRIGLLCILSGLGIYGISACTDDDPAPVTPTNDAGTTTLDASPAVDSGGNSTPADSGTPDVQPTTPQAVTIKFKAKVGTQDFACGTTYTGQGSDNATVEPADLRFFVQDVKLIDGQGNAVPVTLEARAPWQTTSVALLDFENATGGCKNGNAEMNDTVTGTVPPGTYTGISFSNGVPADINHMDPATAPAPLTAGGMTWGWLLGHIFFKAEVIGANDAGGGGLVHLGSVGCSNADAGAEDDFQEAPTLPCKQPNRNEVRLTGFNPATSAIVVDVKTVFQATVLTTRSMCHSGGAACPPMFASVGLEFDGGARTSTHPAFRVE